MFCCCPIRRLAVVRHVGMVERTRVYRGCVTCFVTCGELANAIDTPVLVRVFERTPKELGVFLSRLMEERSEAFVVRLVYSWILEASDHLLCFGVRFRDTDLVRHGFSFVRGGDGEERVRRLESVWHLLPTLNADPHPLDAPGQLGGLGLLRDAHRYEESLLVIVPYADSVEPVWRAQLLNQFILYSRGSRKMRFPLHLTSPFCEGYAPQVHFIGFYFIL